MQYHEYVRLTPYLMCMFKESNPELISVWSRVVAATSDEIVVELLEVCTSSPDLAMRDKLVDMVFGHPRWRTKWFIPNNQWNMEYFLYLLPKFVAQPKVTITPRIIEAEIRGSRRFLALYLALAEQHPSLPIPDWGARAGTNPTFSAVLRPRNSEFIREYLAAGAPASAFDFKFSGMATLQAANKYGALHEILRRDLSPELFMRSCKLYAKNLFVLIVLVTDGYLQLRHDTSTAIARFFAIATLFPLELQSRLASVYAEASCPQSLSNNRFKWGLAPPDN